MTLQQVFEHEWSRLARSRGLARQLEVWRCESDGLIVCATPSDLVDMMANRCPTGDGRAVATWMLQRAGSDEVARRVMLQAMRFMVFSQWKRRLRSNLALMPEADWSATCLSAAWIAVGEQAGRDRPWPMWALRATFMRELAATERLARDIGTRHVEDLDRAVFDRSDDDGVGDAAIALSRLLRDAASSGQITLVDAQVVWLTRVAGYPVSDLATGLGVTPSTLRKRRERTESRVSALMVA